MKSFISGVTIQGICATVPARVSRFADELKEFPFPEKSSIRLGKVMGFKEHRISDPATTPCDLASYTLDYLFHTGKLAREDLDAIIVVSQTADHPIPGNSKVIHGQLGLSNDTHCVDLYENCTGFISGLYAASTMIAAGAQKIALITAETGACYANMRDRNTYPLVGDAAGVALICRSQSPKDGFHFVFHHDGAHRAALLTPAGRMRMPYSAQTAEVQQDEMGNFRSLNDLYMDGTAVFQFVMNQVPPLIREVCEYAGVAVEDIAYHLTHQPNRFMLEKLADMIPVPRERLFNNVVENFGNSSSCTIPVNIAFNLKDKLRKEKFPVCLSAFGAGLSLAAACGSLGGLDFCELIEHPGQGAHRYPPQS